LHRSSFSRVSEVVCAVAIASLFLIPVSMRSGGDSGGSLLAPSAFTSVFAMNVTNTLMIDRPDEVVQMNLTLSDSSITDSTHFTVRRQSGGSEVLSGPLNSTVELYPSGYIHRMRIAFQDSFAPGERKGYIINAGEKTALRGDMACSIGFTAVTVTDGNVTDRRTYMLTTDNSINYYTTGIRVYYDHTTYPFEAQSGILIRVGGDQLSLDQTNFQMGWGTPDSLVADVNSVMVSVHLSYHSPYSAQWGYGATSAWLKDTDVIWADLTVNFYNNNSMIDAYVSKKVNEKFYNHNGFLMETSLLLAGDGNYEYIFGTPDHTRQWANTTSLNWALDWHEFREVEVGNRSAPALGDLDSDGDLDLIVGSADGNLTGFNNTGGPTAPAFTPDANLAPSGGPWDANTKPTLGDLDGDGDLDLVVGLQNGMLIAFRNIGDAYTPLWSRDDTLVAGVLVAATIREAAPELADLNGDGNLDLLEGIATGTFHYYENVGTASVPQFSLNDTEFMYLNEGDTLKPGYFCTPAITDVNRDGYADFVSGTNYTSFGTLVYFQNEGNNSDPRFTKLYPAMFNNVRGPGYYTADYSAPEFGDLNGDGLEDIVIGINNGTLEFYANQGYSLPERHANTMQPLSNGSYRYYYDQDGNDGQYVIRNYSGDFYGWYVVSNPAANASIFRYVPDFARYAYRDEYSGEMYPWAGGNTSYYPFIPAEDGRVGRGILITRAASDATAGGYGYGGTYLSQTGTAGGFLQVPMTAMEHRSRETLVLELPYDHSAALYDLIGARMMNPLRIETDSDITLRSIDITTDPADPGQGQDVTVAANIWNVGFSSASGVEVQFVDGDPSTGGTKIGATQVIASIPAGGVSIASVVWNTAGIIGPRAIFVAIDRSDTVKEMDEDNNVASRTFYVTATRRTWSGEAMISDSTYNDMDPDLVTDANGNIWVAWHTFVAKDDFDIFAKTFNGTGWTGVQNLASGMKRTSAPALAATPNGDVWLIFSSNIVEYDKFITTKNGIYYWSQKFDLWAMNYSHGAWQAPQRFSQAVEKNNADQAPRAAVTPDGTLWTAFRHTYFDLYSHGQQMYNIPYQDMNISARSFNGTAWSSEQIVDNRAGNQGWWGGASLAVSPSGTLWAFYEAELSQTQFEIYYSTNNGSGWTTPARLTNNPGQDVRPVATFDSRGNLIVVWESDRDGEKDLYVKYYNGTSWSSDSRLTTDLGEDMKPAITTDGSGSVLVAWESDRTGNKDIFMKAFDGVAWTPDLQVTTDAHSDEQVRITGSRSGGAMLVWETDRNGYGDKDIYAKILQMPPPKLRTELSGVLYGDVKLTWNFSADDWMSRLVTGYTVMCGEVYDRSGASYAKIADTPANVNSLAILGRGQGDPRNIFCEVIANTPFGSTLPSNQQGAYKITLTGHNLISIPLLIEDPAVTSALATLTNIPSNFTYMRYYDELDAVSPWKIFSMIGPRDSLGLSNDMGLWVGGSGSGQLTVTGTVPDGYTIRLKAGWNLVGYPSLTPRTVSDALAGLPIVRIEGEDSTTPPYNLRVLGGGDVMYPGRGYWIYVSSDSTWLLGG
jgi:hypothetical protein